MSEFQRIARIPRIMRIREILINQTTGTNQSTSRDQPANQPGPTCQPTGAQRDRPACLCLRRQTRPEHTRGDQATAEQTRPGDTGPEYTTKAQTRPTCTHRRHPHRNNLLSSLVRVSSSSNLISLRPVIFGWRMRTKACLRRAALAAAQLASSQMRRRKTTNSSTMVQSPIPKASTLETALMIHAQKICTDCLAKLASAPSTACFDFRKESHSCNTARMNMLLLQ